MPNNAKLHQTGRSVKDQGRRLHELQRLLSDFVRLEQKSRTEMARLGQTISDEIAAYRGFDLQASRCMLMRAAYDEIVRNAQISAGLLMEIATARSQSNTTWFIDNNCIEVLEPMLPGLSSSSILRIASPERSPIAPVAQAMVTEEDRNAVGVGYETKYRFTAVGRGADGNVNATVVPDSWENGAGFHRHLRKYGGYRLEQDGSWIQCVPFGLSCLPGVVSVHVIVLSADDRILLSQRSQQVLYYPGAWSVTFEEQLTNSDLHTASDAAASAARRGFREEFGLDLPGSPDQIVTLSALLELSTLNLAVVVLAISDAPAELIIDRWKSNPRPTSHWEAQAVVSSKLSDFPDASIDGVQAQLLHPTAQMRIRMLQRWRGR